MIPLVLGSIAIGVLIGVCLDDITQVEIEFLS